MNHELFDPVFRRLSSRMSRRAFLGAAAATALAARQGQALRQAPTDASALVQRFYELIDVYQYADAYALLGTKWHAQQSLDRFTNGYGDTAFVQCTTTGETLSSAGATVGVELISWHNDGAIVGYRGTYTVGAEQGEPRILAGDSAIMPAPAGTPPLCGLSTLGLAFGAWQGAAGSRIGSVVATNQGSATCVLGGSPRITLRDDSGQTLVSTSSAGTPPVAVILAPDERAHAPLRFSNWCGATGGSVSVRAEIAGDPGNKRVSDDANGISYPPCNGPGQPATMEIKGWTREAAR